MDGDNPHFGGIILLMPYFHADADANHSDRREEPLKSYLGNAILVRKIRTSFR